MATKSLGKKGLENIIGDSCIINHSAFTEGFPPNPDYRFDEFNKLDRILINRIINRYNIDLNNKNKSNSNRSLMKLFQSIFITGENGVGKSSLISYSYLEHLNKICRLHIEDKTHKFIAHVVVSKPRLTTLSIFNLINSRLIGSFNDSLNNSVLNLINKLMSDNLHLILVLDDAHLLDAKSLLDFIYWIPKDRITLFIISTLNLNQFKEKYYDPSAMKFFPFNEIVFKPYNVEIIFKILWERCEKGFKENTIQPDTLRTLIHLFPDNNIRDFMNKLTTLAENGNNIIELELVQKLLTDKLLTLERLADLSSYEKNVLFFCAKWLNDHKMQAKLHNQSLIEFLSKINSQYFFAPDHDLNSALIKLHTKKLLNLVKTKKNIVDYYIYVLYPNELLMLSSKITSYKIIEVVS